MLINTMGLYWKEENVYWGKQKNPGSLFGRCTTAKKKVVDFREQIGIYVLYDDDLNAIYVGQAGKGVNKLFRRLRQHLTAKDPVSGRWTRFSWFGVLGADDEGNLQPVEDARTVDIKSVLDQLEAILITGTEPGLNRQGGNWHDVEVYEQHLDPRLPPSKEKMLEEIYRHIIKANG